MHEIRETMHPYDDKIYRLPSSSDSEFSITSYIHFPDTIFCVDDGRMFSIHDSYANNTKSSASSIFCSGFHAISFAVTLTKIVF